MLLEFISILTLVKKSIILSAAAQCIVSKMVCCAWGYIIHCHTTNNKIRAIHLMQTYINCDL